MDHSTGATPSNTSTAPVTVREPLRSVDLPTGTLRIVAPATIAPRPAPPTSVFNPDDTEVAEKVASWWQHAEQFLGGEPLDHHANHCFSDGAA